MLLCVFRVNDWLVWYTEIFVFVAMAKLCVPAGIVCRSVRRRRTITPTHRKIKTNSTNGSEVSWRNVPWWGVFIHSHSSGMYVWAHCRLYGRKISTTVHTLDLFVPLFWSCLILFSVPILMLSFSSIFHQAVYANHADAVLNRNLSFSPLCGCPAYPHACICPFSQLRVVVMFYKTNSGLGYIELL